MGPAGNLLNRALKSAGIDREACVVTNVVNAKPPSDEWHRHEVGAVAAGVAALQALCQREQPSLIVALGEQALHTLIAGDPDAKLYKITEARGYVFPSPFGPVLAATHPAFILRNWHPWWALFTMDLQKARRVFEESTHGGWKGGASAARAHFGEAIYTGEAIVWPAPDPTDPLAIDIETNRDLSIACIGWAAQPCSGFCAPFHSGYEPFFRQFLASPNPKVFQNGQFDTTILERHGFEVRNWQHDTMILWSCLEPLLAGKVTLGDDEGGGKATHKGLKFLVSAMTDEPYYKVYDYESEHDQYVLCAKDARLTLELFEKMQEALGEDLTALARLGGLRHDRDQRN